MFMENILLTEQTIFFMGEFIYHAGSKPNQLHYGLALCVNQTINSSDMGLNYFYSIKFYQYLIKISTEKLSLEK